MAKGKSVGESRKVSFGKRKGGKVKKAVTNTILKKEITEDKGGKLPFSFYRIIL